MERSGNGPRFIYEHRFPVHFLYTLTFPSFAHLQAYLIKVIGIEFNFITFALIFSILISLDCYDIVIV